MTDLTMSLFASKDDLLAAQAARIAELESQLEAIGAGGVEPLRKQAAAPQAVQAAAPMFWVRLLRNGLYEGPVHNNSASNKLLRDEKPGEWHPLYLHTAPAHPAEGVPPQASEWDGKLPERLQSVLNALRLELPAAVVNDVEFEVRSHYEAMHTSLSTSRRMYGAARDRLEAIDAAQPDPFAATQPAAQGMEQDAARYRFLRDGDWRENDDVAPFVHLQLNALWDEKIDAALAAQAKQGGAANG